MRTTQYLLATQKETPADAEIISHQLMLRAGLIRKSSTGIYFWLPLGFRTLKKVEAIIREEMNRAGALETLMPAVQDAALWQESQRWQAYGKELLKFKDRHERDFCYGPTHEEVVTDIMRRELRSYKQLPITFYQVQTKFRDEIRPRFGVMRAREFIMKDAYSFHADKESLAQTYEVMYAAYSRIFQRLGLDFRAVLADTGSIGGNKSHEFHVLAKSGEDAIAFSDGSDYAANVELAQALAPNGERPKPAAAMQKVATPGITTIDEVCRYLKVEPHQVVKTLIVKGKDSPAVALILRGDHELNPIKLEKLDQIAQPLTLLEHHEITSLLGCKPGYLGPVKLNIPMIIDRDAAHMTDFICGANEENQHLQNVNWERDVSLGTIADLRKVVEGDLSPDGKGKLKIVRGIEVGHIFQLGNKYSQAMNAKVLNDNGEEIVMEMGCYGIGVTRIVAAAIEQSHDDNGIVWPAAIAPFHVSLIPIQMNKSETVRQAAEKLYQDLLNNNIEVLFDTRDERPGTMFADMDLIGIPHRLVLNEKNLAQGLVEYKKRGDSEVKLIKIEEAIKLLKSAEPQA